MFWNLLCCRENWVKRRTLSIFFRKSFFWQTVPAQIFFLNFQGSKKMQTLTFLRCEMNKKLIFRKRIFQQILIFLKQATLKVWSFVEIWTQNLTCGKENWFKKWCLVRNSIRNLTSCENLAPSLTRLKVLD